MKYPWISITLLVLTLGILIVGHVDMYLLYGLDWGWGWNYDRFIDAMPYTIAVLVFGFGYIWSINK